MSPTPATVPAAPRRFRGIRKQVVLFLSTAFLGFAGLVFLVAWKQGMFVKHTNIYFQAADATGMSKGMPVRLYGFPVGSIRDIELSDRGGVRVRLGINNDYLARVPVGSQARIVREGVVGAASIQIVTGPTGPNRIAVAEGDEIKFQAPRGMLEIADEFRTLMAPAAEELRKAAAQVADPQSDFRRSVRSTREWIEQLPDATRELRQLVRSAEKTSNVLSAQAELVGRQSTATLAAVERLSTQTETQLPVLAGKLSTTLDSLNATANQIRETTKVNGEALRDLLQQAPEVMRGGGELVRDSQEVAAAAKRTWFLRDYVEPAQMRTLPVDSFESFRK